MSSARDDPTSGPDLFLEVCGAVPQTEASAADQPASYTGYNFAQWTDTDHFLGGYTSLLQDAVGAKQQGWQTSNSQSSQASATEGAPCGRHCKQHCSWVSSTWLHSSRPVLSHACQALHCKAPGPGLHNDIVPSPKVYCFVRQ